MCCGRGYDTATVQKEDKCECKFQWCCVVRCKTCRRLVDVHTCKGPAIGDSLMLESSLDSDSGSNRHKGTEPQSREKTRAKDNNDDRHNRYFWREQEEKREHSYITVLTTLKICWYFQKICINVVFIPTNVNILLETSVTMTCHLIFWSHKIF